MPDMEDRLLQDMLLHRADVVVDALGGETHLYRPIDDDKRAFFVRMGVAELQKRLIALIANANS